MFAKWLESQPASSRSWIKSLGQDSHKPGRVVLVPSVTDGDEKGEQEGGVSITEVAFCLGEGEESVASPFSLCSLRDQVRWGRKGVPRLSQAFCLSGMRERDAMLGYMLVMQCEFRTSAACLRLVEYDWLP